MVGPKPAALIVDEDQDNRELFGLAVAKAGFHTVETTNSEEALNLLETRTFDLMMLDLQMPSLNGASVLKIIRANTKYAAMKIVVVTGNAHMKLSEVEELADCVVYKPLDLKKFIHLVERMKGHTANIRLERIRP